MHTHKRTENGEVIFQHNGDFSGRVRIIFHVGDLYRQGAEPGLSNDETDMAIAEIPFEDVKSLVAKYVRDKKIQTLEQMSDEAILGVEYDHYAF